MSGVTRVLQVSGTMNRGGAETFLMNLYRQIDRSRWQFDFVCFGEAKGDYDNEIESLGGQIIRIPGFGLRDWTVGLYKFLRTHSEYQVVHAHTGFSSVYSLGASLFSGVPHRFLHSHNAILKEGRLGRCYASVSRLVGHLTATRRLSCGARAALELHGTTAGVQLFSNCVPLDAFRPDPKMRRSLRAEFGVSDEQKMVIQVGRFEPVKNHRFTLELCERLRADQKFKVLTVGSGSLEQWFISEIQRRGLEGVLVHAGLRRDIPALMAAADAMILPSYHEGFPVVSVEAQASGLPCLFSNAIDQTVDLGLGLVKFLSVDHIEDWIRALEGPLSSSCSFNERKLRLSSLNFDATSAARSYENLLVSS